MSNPFQKITKNSEQSKKEWDVKETSSVQSKQCNTCGAPRPKKTNLTTCDYCGSRFMTIQEKINPDI